MLHVNPKSDASGQLLPLLYVAEHALTALLVELLYAVLFDIALGLEAQLSLNLQLHRKAVGIPSALSQRSVALHGLVAADNVLEYPGQDVMDPWTTVGRWRTFVEHEQRFILSLLALSEDVILLPKVNDLFL